jgi:hypothetical protein
MSATHPGRLRRAAGRSAMLAWLLGLGACTEAPGGLGAWLFISIALLAVSLAAFFWGRLSAAQSSKAELRALRASLQALQQLQLAWSWRTDDSHKLQLWQAPGQGAHMACALFVPAPSTQALVELLQARHAFSGLRLSLPAPLEGSAGWLLSGMPQQDDEGRFSGFLGVASPTDAEDALRATAAAAKACWRPAPSPALLAVDSRQRLAGVAWQCGGAGAVAQRAGRARHAGRCAAHRARGPCSSACMTLQPGQVLDMPGLLPGRVWTDAGRRPRAAADTAPGRGHARPGHRKWRRRQLQLHRVTRPARADPGGGRLHPHRQRRLRAACSTASATTTSTACLVQPRA